MNDPALAAVQARAIAFCVWSGAMLVAACVLLWLLHRQGRFRQPLSAWLAFCVFASIAGPLSAITLSLPDAVAPLPAQEAPK